MSDTPRVGIEVAVDGSGVEAGLARVDAAVNRTGRNLDTLGTRGSAALNTVGAEGSTAAGRVDAATRSMVNSIQRTTAALDAGSRSSREYYEALARQRGINTDALRPYLQQLEEVTQRQAAARAGLDATSGSLGNMGQSAAQTQAALRGVPAQITDIITSLQGGQAPLTVFLQQGGQLRDMFGSAGAAARALGSTVLKMVNPFTVAAAAALAVAVAYNEGSKEADAYNRALILTGNAAATTAGELADMARAISESVGTQSDAAAALAALAGTGDVSSANLQRFGEVAVRAQKSIGISVDETAQAFADLAKSPLAASEKLNEQYRYLTVAVYEQIKALEQQGRAEEAAEVAQNAYADAMDERAKAIKANLGAIESAWAGVTGVAKKAWDSMLNVGREDTLNEKLADVAAKIATQQQKLYSFIDAPEARKQIERLRLEQGLLQDQVREQTKANETKAAANQLAQAGIEWSKEYTKYLDKETQKKNELAAATNKAKAANVDLNSEQFKAVKKGIEDKYEDKGAAAAAKKRLDEQSNLAKAALETQRNIEKEMAAGTLAALESQHKQALISDEAFYKAKRDLQLKDLDAEAALLQKQADRAGKKGDLAEQEKYLGALKVLEQRRANIVASAQNAINEGIYATTKALAEQSRVWSEASSSEAAQLRDELSLFGANAEARKIATAQLKVEADARQFIAAQMKAGRPLSQDQIADLQAETRERQKNIAAIMGERQALAGAEALRAENLKFAAESILNEQDRARALQETDAQTWRDRIALAEEGSEARKRLETEFAQWYQNQSLKPQLEAQRALWRGIESTAHDTFVSIFDSGKSAFDRLRDTLKNGLAELLYQLTIKKWIFNIEASVGASGGISGLASAVSGRTTDGSGTGLLGGASNLLSIGKAIYSGFTGGLASTMGTYITQMGATFGSAAVAEFGAGMSGAAGTNLASGTAAGMGSSFANAIPVIGWIISGMMASNAFYKQGWDFNNGSVNKLGQNLGSGINLVDQLARKLGFSNSTANILSGLAPVSRLFGRKNPEIENQGANLSFDANGAYGHEYANILEKGGVFRSDKRYTLNADISADFAKGLSTSFLQMRDATGELGRVLGVTGVDMLGFSKNLQIVWDKDVTKREQQVTDMLAGLGNDLATYLVPNIAAFATSGEAASTTLQRLATEVVATDAVLNALGATAQQAFGAVGLASIAARERLISLAGGVEALATQVDYYTANFLTEAERIAPVQKQVVEQMAALGYAGVTTVEQFKAVMTGLATSGALATQAGAEAYAGLLAIAPQFKMVADYMKEIAEADAASALQALRDNAELLMGAVDSALTALQRSVDAQRKTVQTAYEESMRDIEASITTAGDAVQRLGSLSNTLRNTLNGMTAPGQEEGTRVAAQAQIRDMLVIAKRSGMLPDADALSTALGRATGSKPDDFATFLDYARDYARTASDIAELSGLTDSQLTTAEKQLRALELQRDDLQKQYEEETSRLDGIIEQAKSQIDILNGINQGVLAIPAALQALAAAIGAAGSNSIIRDQSNTAQISGLYNELLGRNADSEGMAYWSSKLESGWQISEIIAGIKNSDEYKGRVPGFAGGGEHVGGWRVVGEAGPELEYTGPSRIYSNGASRDLFGGLEQRIESLEKVVATGLSRLIAETKRGADATEGVEENTRDPEEIG